MKKEKSLKYVSGRVILLGVLGLAALAFSGGALVGMAVCLEGPLWPGIVVLASAVLLGGAAVLFVARPYHRAEKLTVRFLEGHLLSEADMERVNLTPSMRSQLEAMDQLLRSPQVMDLNKRQAQYLALQNQINPHFLYNTLESIRGEALIAGLDGVAEMTEALAKFFRYTITKVENLVYVEEELDNCETYFSIQKYRFGDRLQLHVEYDPEEWEEIMNCRIPKLTLQPVLENSIIHGTELKIGKGNLWIRFRKTENRLVICISDDGVGMDESTLARLNEKLSQGRESFTREEEEKQGGIALANVNNRIHLIFGDEYGMHVYSVQGSGTDVEISIPVVSSVEMGR